MTSAFCLFVFETFVSRLLALFGTIITSESGNPTPPGDKWERKLLVFGIFYSFLTSGRPLSSSTGVRKCYQHWQIMSDTWLSSWVAGGRRWWGGASRLWFMRGLKMMTSSRTHSLWTSPGARKERFKKGKSSPARECKGHGRVRMA